MFILFCHKTKGVSAQWNYRAVASEQTEVRLDRVAVPQLSCSVGNAAAWARPQRREPRCVGTPGAGRVLGQHCTAFILYLIFFFASLSTSCSQVVHLWCDPLYTFLWVSDFISVLPLVLCLPMKTHYHSLWLYVSGGTDASSENKSRKFFPYALFTLHHILSDLISVSIFFLFILVPCKKWRYWKRWNDYVPVNNVMLTLLPSTNNLFGLKRNIIGYFCLVSLQLI